MKQGPVRFECEVCGNKILTDWREIVFYNKRELEYIKEPYIREAYSFDIKCDVCGVTQVRNIPADEVEGNYICRGI